MNMCVGLAPAKAAYTSICICICAYIYVCVYVCVDMRICIYMYTNEHSLLRRLDTRKGSRGTWF